MFDVELWIYVTIRNGERLESACILFANQKIPMRPLRGESISYHQERDSIRDFEVCTNLGPNRTSILSVEIDDVSHYAVRTEAGISYKTSIYCYGLEVPSLADAKSICGLMTEQFGFEIDPYGPNLIRE